MLSGDPAAVVIGFLGVALVVSLLVYPGELSHLGPGLNRWLYDRAAEGYERKWRSSAYRNVDIIREVTAFGQESLALSGNTEVLDLGCGTGRGTRLLAAHLPPTTRFTAVDFSAAMLRRFDSWMAAHAPELRQRVSLVEADLAIWADEGARRRYGLVLMLEVGEFIPRFADVVETLAASVPAGSGLVATRPAGLWALFFPGRAQTRRALTRLLRRGGFAEPRFLAWRARYEIVLARKT